MGKFIDLTGKQFGNWIVLEYVGKSYWLCKCTCGSNIKRPVFRGSLLKGVSRGCGKCNRKLATIKRNKYDLSGDYGIGYTTNTNAKFLFDKEDYDLIKNYCWMENDKGYIYTQIKKKNLLLHRLVLNAPKDLMVDHIYHDRKDCRKQNMRLVTNQQNSMNKKVNGVYWCTEKNKWVGHLTLTTNGKQKKFFKYFNSFSEAKEYRLQLEQKYFGEYRYLLN